VTLTNFRIGIVILMLVTVAIGQLFIPQLFNCLNLLLGIFMTTEGTNQHKQSKKGASILCFIIACCFTLNFISFFT